MEQYTSQGLDLFGGWGPAAAASHLLPLDGPPLDGLTRFFSIFLPA